MRWLFLVLVGCNGGETDTGEDTFCVDQPVLTYENFGQGFMSLHCQGCHSSERTGEDRFGAPESVHFDDKNEVALLARSILAVATGPAAFMPPSGGLLEDDKEKLEIWLRCFPPEPE